MKTREHMPPNFRRLNRIGVKATMSHLPLADTWASSSIWTQTTTSTQYPKYKTMPPWRLALERKPSLVRSRYHLRLRDRSKERFGRYNNQAKEGISSPEEWDAPRRSLKSTYRQNGTDNDNPSSWFVPGKPWTYWNIY